MSWFNCDVAQAFKRGRVYNRQGVFIGDAPYLFVPDNPKYEVSVKLRFNRHHPVSREAYEGMPEAQRTGCQWRRCYKLVTVLHTAATADRLVFDAVRLISRTDHECPVLYAMVGDVLAAVGGGVMKRLIVDRGFLDGAAISRCKEDHGIDVLIPVRRNMDFYTDAMALFGQADVEWWPGEEPQQSAKPLSRPRPKAIERPEQQRQATLQDQQKPPISPERLLVQREAAAIGGFSSWSACRVPVSVVANREHYADGHVETWLLLDTREVKDPREARGKHHLRTAIEERYRQLKWFCDLAHFTSRALSPVVNQVVLVLLAYNLLQIYLAQRGKEELNKKAPPRLRGQLLPPDNYLIICWQNHYGLFDPYECTALILSFGEETRRKLLEKSRRMHQQLLEGLANPRAP
jgi:hypothetical protein